MCQNIIIFLDATSSMYLQIVSMGMIMIIIIIIIIIIFLHLIDVSPNSFHGHGDEADDGVGNGEVEDKVVDIGSVQNINNHNNHENMLMVIKKPPDLLIM